MIGDVLDHDGGGFQGHEIEGRWNPFLNLGFFVVRFDVAVADGIFRVRERNAAATAGKRKWRKEVVESEDGMMGLVWVDVGLISMEGWEA